MKMSTSINPDPHERTLGNNQIIHRTWNLNR